jgi:antitoxin component YwqK of YwqJK toxin-antitoxin module
MKALFHVSAAALCGATLLLFTGCASFQHQTSETEPHALVIVTQERDVPEQPTVIQIDGLPVRPYREYRVTPGEPEVIISEMVRFDKTYAQEPMISGQSNPTLTLSHSEEPDLNDTSSVMNPSFNQPLNIRLKSWVAYYTTNSIMVESGWRYVLDGMQVSKTSLSIVTKEKVADVSDLYTAPASPDPKGTTPLQPVADERADLDDPEIIAEVFASATPLYTLVQRLDTNGEPVHFHRRNNVPYTGWAQSTQTEFTRNQVSMLMSWKEGKMHGAYGKWYKNEQKAETGIYENGNLEGQVIQWYENGQKEEEGEFRNGKLDGLWMGWNENGQRTGETNYKDGKPHGQVTWWHINGKKRKEAYYKNGKQDGLCSVWYQKGNLTKQTQWKGGVEVEVIEGA